MAMLDMRSTARSFEMPDFLKEKLIFGPWLVIHIHVLYCLISTTISSNAVGITFNPNPHGYGI
jgi:hypothetical protein